MFNQYQLLRHRQMVLLLAMVFAFAVSPAFVFADHRSNGSGTCWFSRQAWPSHQIAYAILPDIPTGWHGAIDSAAAAWNGAASPFTFTKTGNPVATTIGLENRDGGVAHTYRQTSSSTTLSRTWTNFNTRYAHNVGGSNAYDVQNTMTHEFGHWLNLGDITDSSCSEVTMFATVSIGETKKRSLASADQAAINWQYP
jgi:predicted Zn-dependent protease